MCNYATQSKIFPIQKVRKKNISAMPNTFQVVLRQHKFLRFQRHFRQTLLVEFVRDRHDIYRF